MELSELPLERVNSPTLRRAWNAKEHADENMMASYWLKQTMGSIPMILHKTSSVIVRRPSGFVWVRLNPSSNFEIVNEFDRSGRDWDLHL